MRRPCALRLDIDRPETRVYALQPGSRGDCHDNNRHMTTNHDHHAAVQRHGGPDALGVPRWDFSTSVNACGPAPMALEQVRGAIAPA